MPEIIFITVNLLTIIINLGGGYVSIIMALEVAEKLMAGVGN